MRIQAAAWSEGSGFPVRPCNTTRARRRSRCWNSSASASAKSGGRLRRLIRLRHERVERQAPTRICDRNAIAQHQDHALVAQTVGNRPRPLAGRGALRGGERRQSLLHLRQGSLQRGHCQIRGVLPLLVHPLRGDLAVLHGQPPPEPEQRPGEQERDGERHRHPAPKRVKPPSPSHCWSTTAPKGTAARGQIAVGRVSGSCLTHNGRARCPTAPLSRSMDSGGVGHPALPAA